MVGLKSSCMPSPLDAFSQPCVERVWELLRVPSVFSLSFFVLLLLSSFLGFGVSSFLSLVLESRTSLLLLPGSLPQGGGEVVQLQVIVKNCEDNCKLWTIKKLVKVLQ